MTRHRGAWLGAILMGLLLTGGCTVAVSNAPSVPVSAPTAVTPSLPVDTTIQPESLTHPSAMAAQALSQCNAAQFGLDRIAAMGLVPTARQVSSYAPLTGREPELQGATPAFVIQFRGPIPQVKYNGETWIDPICVVVDGDSGFYATGSRILLSGIEVTPDPVPTKPTLSLPPPAP